MGGLDWSLGDLALAVELFRNGEGAAGNPLAAAALRLGLPSGGDYLGYASLSAPLGDWTRLAFLLLADAEAELLLPSLSALVDVAQGASASLTASCAARYAPWSLESAVLAASVKLYF
jgi:hypothetical protein